MHKAKEKFKLHGNKSLKELKDILRKKGVPINGKKKDLIDRVISCQTINNLDCLDSESTDQECVIKTPAASTYKDINKKSPLPDLTEIRVIEYLNRCPKDEIIALDKFNNGFYRYIRYSMQDEKYYAKAQCKLQMEEEICYEVNISFHMDGEILEASCKCIDEHTNTADCEHVIILLNDLCNLNSRKPKIIEMLCLYNEFQTKSKLPKTKCKESPIKANKRGTYNKKIQEQKIKNIEMDDEQYRTYFRNIIINRGLNSNMPILSLYSPANPHGVLNDHSYTFFN